MSNPSEFACTLVRTPLTAALLSVKHNCAFHLRLSLYIVTVHNGGRRDKEEEEEGEGFTYDMEFRWDKNQGDPVLSHIRIRFSHYAF